MKKFKLNKKNLCYFVLIIVTISMIFLLINMYLKNNNSIYSLNEEPTKVSIWTIKGTASDDLKEIIEEYKTIYPDVKFEVNEYENEKYKSIIRDTLVTNEGPDIFFSWGYNFLKEFVQADKILDITDYYKKFGYEEEINSDVLSGFTFDEKIYGIPIQGFNVVLYVNRNLFEQYNLEYPKTYEELLDVIEVFKANNIVPISIGGQEPWVLSFMYLTLAVREEGVDEAIESVEGTHYSIGEGYEIASNKLIELVDREAFGDEFLSLTSNRATFNFIKGEAAMLFSGSFSVDDIEKMGSDIIDDVDIIPFPKTHDESNIYEGIGGYIDGFVINKFTENKDLVSEIYMRLIKDLSHKRSKGGIPIWNEDKVNLEKDTLLYKCYLAFPTYGYQVPYDIILPKKLSDEHLESLVKLCKKQISVSDFINNYNK